eukprot:g4432.t1
MSTAFLTYLFVGLSFVLYIGIAIWSRAASTKDFYVAGGGVHPVANGMATAADWMSAASFISMAGIIAFSGYDGSVYLMGWTGGYVLLALLLAPYLRKFGQFTVPDFIGERYYSKTARVVAVVCLIFISFTYVAGQMRGVGIVFSRFLEVDINTGVIIGMAIVFFYAVLGGMKGITYTQVSDARKSAGYALLFIALLYTTAPSVGAFARLNFIEEIHNTEYSQAPGWFKTWEDVGLYAWRDKNEDGRMQYAPGGAFEGRPDFTGEQGEHGERLVNNAETASQNEIYIDRDTMVLANPEIAKLPGWVIALVAAGAVAAALSTAAGLLLVISASISHDLLKRTLMPAINEKQELFFARLAAAVAVCIAGWFGINPPGFVAQVVAFAFGLAASSLFPAIFMGIFFKRMNKEGAIAGMLEGMRNAIATLLPLDITSLTRGEARWQAEAVLSADLIPSENDLVRKCDAGFKQGAKFAQWATGKEDDYYYHPFNVTEGYPRVDIAPYWLANAGKGNTLEKTERSAFSDATCWQEYLCEMGLAPKSLSTAEYADVANYAYHLDAGKLATLLKEHCRDNLNVHHIVDEVTAVNQGDDGYIQSVSTKTQGEIAGDLFVDCTGLGCLLLGKTLGVPFIDQSDTLFIDQAIAMQVPYKDETSPVATHTISTAQEAGWIWDIGLGSRRGVGHVYSSRHMQDDDAEQILREYLGADADGLSARRLQFNNGHREKFWEKNCVAIGMSAGFLEPLEATAIMLIEISATMVAEQFPPNTEVMDITAERFNKAFQYRWKAIIDFLKLHYCLSQRPEPFWADNRDPSTIPESLQQLLALWKYQAPSDYDFSSQYELFRSPSYQFVLYAYVNRFDGFQADVKRLIYRCACGIKNAYDPKGVVIVIAKAGRAQTVRENKTIVDFVVEFSCDFCAENDVKNRPVLAEVEYEVIEWTDLMPPLDLAALQSQVIDHGQAPDSSSAPEWESEDIIGSEMDSWDNPQDSFQQDAYQSALVSTRTVDALNGKDIKLPGFIVPLEFDDEMTITQFFLVPYFGACIHLPPPPPNQMVLVDYPEGVQMEALYTPFWVSGKLSIQIMENESAEEVGASIENITIIGTRQAYQGNFLPMEIPQAELSIDSETLRDAGALDLVQALDLSASVARQNNFGGLWNSFAVRGFVGDENLPSNYLVNGFNAGRGFGGARDLSGIESVEVLKGPRAALFGRGEPGGTVNLVTKRPTFETAGELSVSAGSDSTYRTDIDYTSPISEEVAIRLVGFYEDAESFRDTIETNKIGFSPSLLWRTGDSSQLVYEMEYSTQEIPFDRGVIAINDELGVIPESRFLGEPDYGPIETDVLGHQIEFQQDLNEGWSALVGFNYRDTSLEGYASENGFSAPDEEGNFGRFTRYRDYDATYQVFRAELSGSFNTGELAHRLIIGVDADEFENDQYAERDRSTDQSINIFDPVYGAYPISSLTLPVQIDRVETQESIGFYIQDQISLTEKLDIRLGARFDDYQQELVNRSSDSLSEYSESQVSPQLGVVYKASDAVSFYAVYGENFRPLSGATDENGLDPNLSESTEVGIKFVLNDGALAGTFAIFDVEQSNIATFDADFNPTAVGAAGSQGVEFDLTGNLTDSLSLWLSYAYVDAETKNDYTDFISYNFIPAGSDLLNVAENQLSLQLVQQLQLAGRDFDFIGGLTYVGDRSGEFGDPTFRLPSYTTVRMAANYAVSDALALRAEVSNLFDEEYYTNSYADVWVQPAIEAALDRVSLNSEARSNKLRDYSKGMRQKVAIALAILRDTEILLLDEPTSGLDPGAIDEFHHLVRDLADSALAALWLLLVLVLPAIAVNVAARTVPIAGKIETELVMLTEIVPIPHGADILMTQREAVNDAWDLPKEDTMQPFLQRHPEWANTPAIEGTWDWKWYYAFQQVGDQKAEALSDAYSAGRIERDRMAGLLALIAPPALLERSLQGLADTDVSAVLDYENEARAFHAKLRAFYYPGLFGDETFDPSVIDNLPVFEAKGSMPTAPEE